VPFCQSQQLQIMYHGLFFLSHFFSILVQRWWFAVVHEFADQEELLLVKILTTVQYQHHYHAYEVAETTELQTIRHKDLNYRPLEIIIPYGERKLWCALNIMYFNMYMPYCNYSQNNESTAIFLHFIIVQKINLHCCIKLLLQLHGYLPIRLKHW